MEKVKSLDDLLTLRDRFGQEMRMRVMSNNPEKYPQIRIAMDNCGIQAGAGEVLDYMCRRIEELGMEAIISKCGCMGSCGAEPQVEVEIPGGRPVIFSYVDKKSADQILQDYILCGILPEINWKYNTNF